MAPQPGQPAECRLRWRVGLQSRESSIAATLLKHGGPVSEMAAQHVPAEARRSRGCLRRSARTSSRGRILSWQNHYGRSRRTHAASRRSGCRSRSVTVDRAGEFSDDEMTTEPTALCQPETVIWDVRHGTSRPMRSVPQRYARSRLMVAISIDFATPCCRGSFWLGRQTAQQNDRYQRSSSRSNIEVCSRAAVAGRRRSHALRRPIVWKE